MALLSINPVRKDREPSALEKVAMGLGIAKDVLGLAMVPGQISREKEKLATDRARTQADIFTKFEPVEGPKPVTIPGTMGMTVPGEGITGELPEGGFRPGKDLASTLGMQANQILVPRREADPLKEEKIKDAKPLSSDPVFMKQVAEFNPAIANTPGITIGDAKKMMVSSFETPQQKEARDRAAAMLKFADLASRQKQADFKRKQGEAEREEAALVVEPLGQKAKTPKIAEDTRKALASVATAERVIDRLIKTREAEGGTAFGKKRERGKQDATILNFIFKDIEELGALQKPDLELLDNLIPQDPLEILQMQPVTGDTILDKLINLKATFKQKVIDRLRSNGFDINDKMFNNALKQFQEAMPAPNGLKRVVQDGVTFQWDGFEYVAEGDE